ncbi:MAG: hypothetical protein KME13_02720 [Myxacorys californica WJT36-NPBG1]|nr:hypothetical protein [Myxacorys californica WJT36-NPBG1]
MVVSRWQITNDPKMPAKNDAIAPHQSTIASFNLDQIPRSLPLILCTFFNL